MSEVHAGLPASLSRARWGALERAVDAALDAAPSERDALIEQRLADDPELRDAALAWLRACEREDGVLDVPPATRSLLAAFGAAAPPTSDDDAELPEHAPPGLQVGAWRLLHELGRGGMGTVHLAEHTDAELPMRAALKLMHPFARMDAVGVRRFRDERRFLATLEHPSIARLLDGGVHDGLPWFAMEYVQGAAIDAWCDRRVLSVTDRIRLFCRVCDAVQHAHAHLIIHRDLKPANILVSDAGDPKLLDFGIAKLIAPDDAATRLTRAGGEPFTPAFAAPEQLRGEVPTTATDVHALGGVLFLLLTGQPAAGPHLARASDPPRASTVVRPRARSGDERDERCAHIAAARATTPLRLARRLRGDLDTILARAMHPDPERRYPTADALAADLRRHLEGRPVIARRDTLSYRLRKLVARHPVGSVATAAAAALLLGFASITAVQAAKLRAQAVTLTSERDKAAEVTRLLTGILSSADPYQDEGRVPTLREVLDRGAEQVAATLRDRPDVHAHLLSAMAPAYFGLGDWDRAGELAEQAVTLRRRLLPADHPDLGAALLYLATVRLNQGRADEAVAQAREALAIRRRSDTGIDTARALSALGAALQRGGHADEAERVLRSLLQVERDRSPATPAAVAQVARNLAHALRDQRRFPEALPLYAEAYALHRGAYGDDHPETANSAVNLGRAYLETGEVQLGTALLRLGVTTKRRILGIDHRDVAGDQLTLADALRRQGRVAEADSLQREAESALERASQATR